MRSPIERLREAHTRALHGEEVSRQPAEELPEELQDARRTTLLAKLLIRHCGLAYPSSMYDDPTSPLRHQPDASRQERFMQEFGMGEEGVGRLVLKVSTLQVIYRYFELLYNGPNGQYEQIEVFLADGGIVNNPRQGQTGLAGIDDGDRGIVNKPIAYNSDEYNFVRSTTGLFLPAAFDELVAEGE